MFRFIVIGGGCYGIYHSSQLYKAIQKGKLPAESRLIIVDRNMRPKALDVHGDKPVFIFVQSDWQAYLQEFFSDPSRFNPETDGETVQIVPAPFAPHLLFDWLLFSSSQALHEAGYTNLVLERAPFDEHLNLPYEYTDQKGNHYLSRAGWTCPTACIEPQKCPAIKDTRDWDLEDDVKQYAAGFPVKPSVTAAIRLQNEGKRNPLPSGARVPGDELPLDRGYSGAITFTCHHFSHGIGTTPARQLVEARRQVINIAKGLDSSRPEARIAIGTVSRCHGVVATLKISLVQTAPVIAR
jgi:hypothetical protein